MISLERDHSLLKQVHHVQLGTSLVHILTVSREQTGIFQGQTTKTQNGAFSLGAMSIHANVTLVLLWCLRTCLLQHTKAILFTIRMTLAAGRIHTQRRHTRQLV